MLAPIIWHQFYSRFQAAIKIRNTGKNNDVMNKNNIVREREGHEQDGDLWTRLVPDGSPISDSRIFYADTIYEYDDERHQPKVGIKFGSSFVGRDTMYL